MEPAPNSYRFNYSECLTHVPAELRRLSQWVVWRWEVRGGRRTKQPFRADYPASEASTTDPSTWSTFDQAIQTASKGSVSGIGFVFSPDDPYCGVDFDNALSSSGEVLPWANEWLQRLGGYQEISPSGRGIKVIVRARVPRGRKVQGLGPDQTGGLEVYSGARFFTVTGDVCDTRPIEDRQAVIDSLLTELAPPIVEHVAPSTRPTVPLLPNDDELMRRARNASNGDKLSRLFDQGDTSGYAEDDSAADLALCSILAFWAGPDPDRIDRIFRQSALMRPKWDEKRGSYTYGERTIDQALNRSEYYSCQTNTMGQNGQNGQNHMHEWGSVRSVRFVPSDSSDIHEWLPPVVKQMEQAIDFPLEALPKDLQMLCWEGSQAMQCPVDYFGTLALGYAGAVIGRSVLLKVKAHYYQQANLYLAIVGLPGIKKTPPMEILSKPLWEINRELIEEYEREKLIYEEDKREYDRDRRTKGGEVKAPPTPPKRLHLVMEDATREAVAKAHHDNPRGLLVTKDEITAWVASMNQYKAGGKGDDKQFWMSANSGAPIKVDRKGNQDPIFVPHSCITVLGPVTPGALYSIRSNADDGWLDRILFSYPETPELEEWSEYEISDEYLRRWHDAIKALWSTEMDFDFDSNRRIPHVVTFLDAAKERFKNWINQHRGQQKVASFPTLLRGPWSKMEGFFARLCLLLSRLDQAYDPTAPSTPWPVRESHVEGAAKLADYYKVHFRRARHDLTQRAEDQPYAATKALTWFIEEEITEFTGRDLIRQFRDLTTKERDQALQWLEQNRYIRVHPKSYQTKPQGGRPSPTYEVNPYLFSANTNTKDKTDRTDKTQRMDADQQQDEESR